MRYREGWQRVCRRHRRWTLGAGEGHDLEHLDLGACPDIAAAQRRWPAVARRATAAGVAPGAVFALARAVVCQWWELALDWQDERIWPARLHALAGGDAGPQFWRWRVVAREAAVFPEVMALAQALLDPAVAEMVWRDSGAEHIRPFPPDGEFGRELGRRLGRPWLGAAGAVPSSSVLNRWWGALVRHRRGTGQPGDWGQDPWWIPREDQPASTAAQLRTLAQRTDGTITWRATIPPTRTQLDQRQDPRSHRTPGHPRRPRHRTPGHRHPGPDQHPQPDHRHPRPSSHRRRQRRPHRRHPPRPPRRLDPHPPPTRHRPPPRLPGGAVRVGIPAERGHRDTECLEPARPGQLRSGRCTRAPQACRR
jgi:hypothetical protein